MAIPGPNDHPFHQNMYNPRPMPPPSPQQYPRYQPQSHHQNQLSYPSSTYKTEFQPSSSISLQNNHKRPGSSMSISSMLDAAPERHHDTSQDYHQHIRQHSAQVSLSALMSPPHQPTRAGLAEYPYNRSQTPDGFDSVYSGNRHRSASGPAMPLERGFYSTHDRYSKTFAPHTSALPALPRLPEQDDESSARRTSINSILQRPNSQPHASFTQPLHNRPFDPPSRNNWYADPPSATSEPQRSDPFSSAYDTRPPSFRDNARTNNLMQRSPQLPPPPQPISPEIRRPQPNGHNKSAISGLLNGSNESHSHNMTRQDSTQSQSDRSVGEISRFRHFSPFAGFFNAQNGAGRSEELARKNSDEATHKTIFGLGLDGRRGRFSPVPQAVHGAQPQTPVPDSGLNGDQGRVFSGIGGGTSSLTPLPGSHSPFKHEDQILQNGDHLKMSRSSSGIGKRSRRQNDEAGRGSGDQEGRKNGSVKGSKRPKHQNSYKTDLEELAAAQRRSTPLSATLSRTQTVNLPAIRHDQYQPTRARKTVKVANIVAQTLRKPRRHLGSFRYDANITMADDGPYEVEDDPDLCIKPCLPPSFSANEHLNCTYTIHVSKTWLQQKERQMITSSRNLWGTAIYSDDSDPIAAAMHMGWIQPEHQNVDESLLAKIVSEQNTKVDLKDLRPPSKPITLPMGKDIKITCIVMPQLEKYLDSSRFGIQSRAWPEYDGHTPHDGVSFSILKVEVVDVGPLERKLGRVGKDKKAWSEAQTRHRLQFLPMIASIKPIKPIQSKSKKLKMINGKKLAEMPRSPLSNEIMMDPLSYDRPNEWHQSIAIAAA